MNRRTLRGDNHVTSRREAEMDSLLRESLRASGMEGKPLHLQSMPFTQNAGEVASGMFGPPAWTLRLKEIYDLCTRLTETLETAWAAHARRWQGKPRDFAKQWRTYLAKLDLGRLNTQIEKHNQWYPIEARLPIVYPTGEYHIPTGIEYPQKLVSVDSLLELYPDDLDMALYFTQRA